MAKGDVANKRRRVRWYQFTIRRLIVLQLLIVFTWWMFNDVHLSTGRHLRGAWIKPKFSAVHGVREIAAYETDGDWCLCFYFDSELPFAIRWFENGDIWVQKHGGGLWRLK